ncbi:MAG TPA: acyl-CoA dehydrogenase family protein [Candidatus Dormibacteraeota bacterium]|jgi:hypothetical protein|nr:acyl-CoA dehydrogenase family protein [Candidatus Dormibacteraeota bacterium]
MDFGYDQDQEALRDLARKMLSDRATPRRLEEVEAGEERIDRDLWAEMAAAGLLGVCIPEEFGGSGLGLVELSVILEEVGRAVAPVPAWSTLALGALPVAEFGSTAQKESLLPGVVRGDVILSAALQEPGNYDPLSPVTTTATAAEGGWRLDGVKVSVPAAAQATAIIVPARVEGGVGLFLVEPGATGVSLEPTEMTNREIQYTLTLDGVEVAESAELGDLARGREILDWLVQRASAGLCAMQVGVVDRAVRMTAEYTSSREQFERPLAAFQAVSQRAANAYVDAESVKLTTMAAIWKLSEGLDATEEVAVAKFFAAEAAQRAVHAAQHLHGGVGVDLSYPLHRYFIWAKQIELTLGGGTQQLLRLGEILATEAVA